MSIPTPKVRAPQAKTPHLSQQPPCAGRYSDKNGLGYRAARRIRSIEVTMQRLTATFAAIGEDGQKYRVHVFTDYKTVAGQEVPGRQVFLTSDGLSVDRIDKGQYRLALGGILLTSSDPKAP